MSEENKSASPAAKSGKESAGNTQGSNESSNNARPPKQSSGIVKHLFGYTLALLLIGGLGYLYYTTYLVSQQLISANNERSIENSRQLEELQSKQANVEGDLSLKYRQLQELATADKQRIDELEESSLALQQLIPTIQEQIKPRELGQLQLSQLLFLAEQERALGSRPANINYLLRQVQELLASIPAGEVAPELRRLVIQDLNNYAELARISIGEVYQELDSLEDIITADLEFKSSFYDQIANTEEQDSQQTSRVPGFLKAFASSISSYVRISRDTEPDQILTQDKRELTLSTMVLMLNQAKSALIQRDQDLFQSVLENTKQDVDKFFADDLEKDRVIALLEQLLNAEILPSELPALRSYEFLSRSR